MPVHKRPKCVRYRASHTHGKGSKKKRRGSGNRGGKGYSSTGKRSDAKVPSIWKGPRYLGKVGFKNPRYDKADHDVMNLWDIEEKVDSWVAQGKAEHKAGAYSLDLAKVGVRKLLSQGKVTKKLAITVEKASEGAIAKVKEAGGQVTVA
ncbi:MAG TPA: uL15 family ribosomal protein [Candidatus Nanoarchaeia archaeon]|nr:uL15 family ribosomal protein [Candidatus Nanoarchaeia archaeon]